MTFAAYILRFCLEMLFHLVTLIFELLTLAMSDELRSTLSIQRPIFSILQIIIRSGVLCDSIWCHYLQLERSLRMRSITWPVSPKTTGNKFL